MGGRIDVTHQLEELRTYANPAAPAGGESLEFFSSTVPADPIALTTELLASPVAVASIYDLALIDPNRFKLAILGNVDFKRLITLPRL